MEELISSYLDGEPLGDEQKARLQEQIASDPAVRDEYRAVEIARKAVRASAGEVRATTPAHVRAAVLASLRNGEQTAQQPVATTEKPAPRTSANILGLSLRYWLSAAAMIAAVAIGYFAFGIGAPAQLAFVHPANENYRVQSYSNFLAVKKGLVAFHKTTASYSELTSFFREYGVDYDLIPPEIPAKLLGGVISEHRGHRMAHLVFDYKGTLIYMFQAPRKAFSQHTVEVEDRVLYIVDHGAWYWEANVGNGTLAIWEKGATVCAIVADLTPDSLQSLLQHKG